MPIEPGQQVASGRNLAMLASIDRFIAQLNIPEKQIKDVLPGQKVLLDTRSSKIEGRVQRIEPAVINSTVQVDVELTGKLPKEARPELTVDGVIEITTIPDTLFVKRPMFSNSICCYADNQLIGYRCGTGNNINMAACDRIKCSGIDSNMSH